LRKPTRRRTVASRLPLGQRGCLFCLEDAGPFTSEEHVIPRNFGPDADRFVIPPGVVCDPCNTWLGRQVDAPFADRFDVRVTRALEALTGRAGAPPLVIDGRDPTARLDIEVDGGTVTVYASRADETADGGLDIEIRPVQRDPPDIIARTLRALWKMALGCAWLARGAEALDPRWDHLRHAVLGAPLRGYLLQRPFVVAVTRHLDVRVDLDRPSAPDAITFALGGVVLGAPLAQDAAITPRARAGSGLGGMDDRRPSTRRRAPASRAEVGPAAARDPRDAS
jgi:hypothetical protein